MRLLVLALVLVAHISAAVLSSIVVSKNRASLLQKASGIVAKRQHRFVARGPSIAWHHKIVRKWPLSVFKRRPKARAANTVTSNEITASNVEQIIRHIQLTRTPVFHPAQLEWPFDPESITVPLWAREKFVLTEYCPARINADIGAGQRVGLLTRWDTIKLNTMYCPDKVVTDADPHRGPCVIPRQKGLDEFKRRSWAYKRLHRKQHSTQ